MRFDRPDVTFLPLASGYPSLMAHHRHLLDDAVRTEAFRKAVGRVVKEGDVVADVGTGTGILAVSARQAGARRVYAVDVDPIVRLARELARDNGVDGIDWIERNALEVDLPEKVDVLVSECFGVLGVGGTMIQAVLGFRDRWLRAGGTVVPRSLAVLLAPVEAPRADRYVGVWSRARYGLDWSAAGRLARHNLYNLEIEADALLAAPERVLALDLARDRFDGTSAVAEVAFTAARRGRVHGFCGWFDAELCPGVKLSTAPGRRPTVWRQVFLPLPRAVPVGKGARIGLAFATRAGSRWPDFHWTTEIGGVRFEQSTRASAPGGA